jgi:hypothetical protein
LAGAKILTRIGAEAFQAGWIAEKVLSPFVHVTAYRILAAYLHSANGVDDGCACRRLLSLSLDDLTPVISLVAHLDPGSKPGGLLKRPLTIIHVYDTIICWRYA